MDFFTSFLAGAENGRKYLDDKYNRQTISNQIELLHLLCDPSKLEDLMNSEIKSLDVKINEEYKKIEILKKQPNKKDVNSEITSLDAKIQEEKEKIDILKGQPDTKKVQTEIKSKESSIQWSKLSKTNLLLWRKIKPFGSEDVQKNVNFLNYIKDILGVSGNIRAGLEEMRNDANYK